MKSLLGAGVLVALMSAGGLSSDALSGFDEPDQGKHQKQQQADKKADKRAAKADREAQRTERAAEQEHPHGGPPGQQQRGRAEPPAWAGEPDERTAEPPGLASKPDDHPSKTHGRP